MEKQVKTYIKALKKSINQERFLIRVAGLEYEVAQKLPHAAPVQENCGPGWERDNGRCGKNEGLDQSCFDCSWQSSGENEPQTCGIECQTYQLHLYS